MNARGPKFEFVLAWAACVVFCCVVPPCRAESSPAQSSVLIRYPAAPAVAELINQLGDPSPHKRNEASERLRTATDDTLRPALLDAAHHSPNPEIQWRAAKLLCNLSWSKPGDLDSVRAALGNYRTPIIEKRMDAIARLGAMKSLAVPALVRILEEEPSDEVRWVIVSQLRLMEEGSQPILGNLKPPVDDAPMLAAAGWGLQKNNPDLAASHFRRAIAVAATQPVDDHGELDLLIQVLTARAISRSDFAEAVDLYRQQMGFAEGSAEEAVQGLFTLHARFGPQLGFERDVKCFESYFAQPEMMYVLGRIYAKQGNQLASVACYAAAAAANLGDPDGHVRVGEFLMIHQWFDLARPELRRALGNGTEDSVSRDALVYYQLSRCADSMGDDLLAATDLESAVAELRALPGAGIAQARIGLYSALTDWHRLRDAAQKGNRAELTRLVDKLMAGHQVNLDEVVAVDLDIDLARALKTLGRIEDGKKVFDEAYPKLRLKLDQAPHTAEALNNLAWLCARSGEHLEEAYQLSKESIQLAPGNAAYLDTAAEAAAAMGKWDEAIERETAALALQPGDRFMTQQVERFRTGLAKSASPRP